MNWIIEKTVSKGDYTYAIVRNHPGATKSGYVLEHRIVAENSLGRMLEDWEVVHHINGNTKDNTPENLQVMSRSVHASLHAKKSEKMVLMCAHCGEEFLRDRNQRASVKGYRNSFCSRRCSGKFNGFKKKSK